MSDEAIPGDIIQAAEEQLRAYYVNYQSRPSDAIVQIIARAIQAERERWQARIAELEQQIEDMDRLDRSVW